MCGLNFVTDEQYIISMNNAILHRGIYGCVSHLTGNNRGLGHIRLPIQGLDSRYDQPFKYRGNLFLFVGEIYNYKKLMPEAKSDIEVLVRFWDLFGIECFNYFDGFWSVLIYEINQDILHVITDYKKPLYMYINKDLVGISSEIKALCCLKEKLDLNHLHIARIFKFGYDSSTNTFDKYINRLLPNTYYRFNFKHGYDKYFTESLCLKNIYGLDSLVRLLDMSISNRLTSDIPVGLLLSGGLDSTILYTLLKCKKQDLTLFHIDNGEEEFLNYLDIPASMKLIKLKLDLGDLDTILYYNESFADLGSMQQQYALSKAVAAVGYNVVISGDGADELFGGYTRMKDYDAQYSDVYDELYMYHLPRLDKLMMANTVELRCPYLMRDIINFSFTLSYQSRIYKQYLKDSFSNIIPQQILDRKKKPLKINNVIAQPMEYKKELFDRFMKIIPHYYNKVSKEREVII